MPLILFFSNLYSLVHAASCPHLPLLRISAAVADLKACIKTQAIALKDRDSLSDLPTGSMPTDDWRTEVRILPTISLGKGFSNQVQFILSRLCLSVCWMSVMFVVI